VLSHRLLLAAAAARAVKNKKKRFYSKRSEQYIKRVFFPPGYAELEPSASNLASSSSGASVFFCA
jgi:hypothetical protein